MKIKKKCRWLAGLFVLLMAFAVTERMEAAPNISEITSGPIKLIYDYIGHYELNYTGNTNNYDYWNSSGTSRIVSKNYKDRTDIATDNNSSATISKTDSKSKIVKAYLIWETRAEEGTTIPIVFITPNDKKIAVTAAYACKDTRTNNAGQEYSAVYTMATDVTSIVCGSNGGYGTYTVANIPVWEGARSGVTCGGESVASWQLVVVEESPNFPLRTISLNLMSQYFYNVDYTIKLDFADASSPNGVVTATFLHGDVDVDTDYRLDGIGYEDDYNYEANGILYRYMTQTRGLYKNGVSFNNRDTGQIGYRGSNAIGGIRMHLFDDFRRTNSVGSQNLTYDFAGTNVGVNMFLYGVAIDVFAYDIIFDGNGATSGSMDAMNCVYGRGYNLPENAYIRQYYEFAGWNTKEDGSGDTYSNLAYVRNLTSTEKSVTLYAQWKPVGYQISLDNQYATIAGTPYYFEWYGVDNYTDIDCKTTISKITVPQKKGYIFEGYYTSPKGVGTQYIKSNGSITATSITFTSDTTLYAYWTPKVSKITLDNQGATSAGTTQYYQKFNVGNYTTSACTTSISKITNPKKSHYTFQGYYTEKNGEGQRIIDSNGNILEAYTLFEEDTTLFAYWEPVTYTITLNNQNPTTFGDEKFYEKYGVANFSEAQTVTTSIGNKTVTFNYTGSYQTFVAPFEGWYHLETWGAQGSSLYEEGFYGGFGSGDVYLKKGEVLYVYVGGQPSGTEAGFNGGGAGWIDPTTGALIAGGGGATDFRRGGTALSDRILVAGGGGASSSIPTSSGNITMGSARIKNLNSSAGSNYYYAYIIAGGYKTLSAYQTILFGTSGGYWMTRSDGIMNVIGNTSVVTKDVSNIENLTYRFYHGTIGQGSYGGGGGYCGGGYYTYENSVPLNGNLIHPCLGGTGYIGGVVNGVYAEDGFSGQQILDLGYNTGHGKAYITYTDYNYTTELKETTSVTIPEKKGYRFGGYYTGTNGTGTCYVDASGNILSTSTTFTEDVTLYAYWITDGSNVYRIAFNGNGATDGRMDIMICDFDTNYTLNANAFTKTGYAFAGWNTKPDGSGTTYANQATVKNLSTTSGDVVTLHAQWTTANVSYTVNHYLEKLEGGWSLYNTESKTGKTNSNVSVTSFKKTLTGFTYSHAEVKGDAVTSAIIQADGSLVINLYYTRNSYMVTLNKGIGIESVTGAGMYKYEEEVTIKATVLKEYKWYSWVGTYSSDDKTYRFTMPAENVSMTATTNPIVFKISLDNQRSTEFGTTEYYEKYGVGNYADSSCETSLMAITTPKKTGYTFSGYYTKVNGGGTQYITADGNLTASSTDFVEDTTLYAYWVPITYIIRFEGNGSTGGSMSDFVCIYGDYCQLPKNEFTKTHYAFNSWNTEADGSGVTYTNGSFFENLTTVQNGVITLYAQWNPNKYTIHFDANGGVGYMEDLVLSYDTPEKLPLNVFARNNGYGDSTFLGWSILADTREVLYKDGAEVVNATEIDGSTLTLYAVWDDCPWIQVEDQYYSLSDAQNGLITYDELMSHATASDREDGENIPAGINPETGTSFTIIDYAPTDFTFFTSDGSVTETFQVVDNVGNSYKQMITVYIIDTEPEVVKPEGTIRFINEKYYYLPYEEGGLEDNSIWKTDSEYVRVMEEAFENSRNNTPEMSFYFEYEDILKMKEFIRENGIGNTVHEDALERFYEQFMEPNTMN